MKDMDWSHLPREHQERWAALGWSRWAWNDESMRERPPSATLDFHQLTPKQQTAARGLGCAELP